MPAEEGPPGFTLINIGPLLLLVLAGFGTLPPALAFNVDTRNALIITGPYQSYFGYSLAFYQDHHQKDPMLIVGAPKFRQSKTHGRIFNCDLNLNTSCSPIVVDLYDTIPPYSNAEYWIGGTLDTNQHKDKVVVCAHRYTVILDRSVRMIGACVEMSHPFDKASMKVLDCKGAQKKNHVFYYGFAQFGTSMTYSKDNSTLLIGTPGLYQGKGGFAIYKGGNCEIVDYSDQQRNMVHTDDAYEYQMVGYSITSGRYFNQQVYTVVGAPSISTSGLGKVYIYSAGTLIQYYKGTQFGSGFGSSLLTVDINGDGNDDLVVGAPHQYNIRNEGTAHVLISTGWGLFQRSELKGDNVINAHFGTSLENLGDINKDGFEDFVVGAPYEADCGAIYIYFGNHLKPRETNRQKILGKTLHSSLQGFGISFSKAMDIDGNGYNDFAVGSFLSDQAVLLYSREIKAETSLTSSPRELDPYNVACFGNVYSSKCLYLILCIKLKGKNLTNIRTNINVDVDVDQKRSKKRVDYPDPKIKEVFLQSDKKMCFKVNLKTRKTSDIFSPVMVEFQIAYSINSSCTTCTEQNLLDTSVLTKEIPFVTECGKDKVCHSEIIPNLQIVQPRTNDILIVSDSTMFRVRVTVRNTEEPAYQPVGTLIYPHYVEYIPNSATDGVTCSVETLLTIRKKQRNVVTCSLKNPIRREDFIYNMTFEISEKHLKFGSFPIEFSVKSQSEELCTENNRQRLNVKMRKYAKLTVSSLSDPMYIVVSDRRNASHEMQTVLHKYRFYNEGPSGLENVSVSGSVNNIFHQIEGKPKGIIRQVKFEITQKESQPQVKCKNWNDDKGFYFHCEATNFTKLNSFNINLRLQLFTRFTLSALPTLQSNITIAAKSDRQYLRGIQNTELAYKVITKLRSDRKAIQLWIIILCVCLGLFLLVAVIFCLRKCGFFERQKVHHLRGTSGKMRQLSQPDPDEDEKE
ncbi:integrin alpha-4-like [Argonauta hians]